MPTYLNLFSFHEIPFFIYYKFVLNQQNSNASNGMDSNVNIKKCIKSKTNIQDQIQTLN